MNALELSKTIRPGMSNAAPGGEYPKLLYRKTDEERRVVQTDGNSSYSGKESYLVENRFHGKLCDTLLVNSADEAEAAAEDGWDVSPAAAYGEVEGLQAVATAKDAEIAELRALLAAQTEGGEPNEPVRRGPGRPPKVRED